MEPASAILPALRSATAEAHRQLEDAVAIERCLADPAQYRRLLQIFLGFYRPLETRLGAVLGWTDHGIDFPARRKTSWLIADLSALGLTAAQIDTLPDCKELPLTDALASGFGCLYVLEGATLGGRQITAMMDRSAIPADARRFFNSYGAETGTRWREFLAALESHATAIRDTDRMQVVRVARETFACLQSWFMREYHAHEHPG